MSEANRDNKGGNEPAPSRRDVLCGGVRAAGLLAFGGFLGATALSRRTEGTVWQIDPYKCTWCSKCATSCVLNPSAVKCYNVFPLCGYCNLCTGYFEAQPNSLNTGAENQLCPTGALVRKWVEGDYYQYTVDAAACIGCAKCVKGCTEFGNGSLFLQIDHAQCVGCNQCSIAAVCPAEAISRVPAKQPYILKDKTRST
jgi:electron transport complex protein RnfB